MLSASVAGSSWSAWKTRTTWNTWTKGGWYFLTEKSWTCLWVHQKSLCQRKNKKGEVFKNVFTHNFRQCFHHDGKCALLRRALTWTCLSPTHYMPTSIHQRTVSQKYIINRKKLLTTSRFIFLSVYFSFVFFLFLCFLFFLIKIKIMAMIFFFQTEVEGLTVQEIFVYFEDYTRVFTWLMSAADF